MILLQHTRLGSARTALAVAALYALLLQGFLGGLATVDPFAALHCAPTAAQGGHGSQAPAAHDAACCLLACRTVLGVPPDGPRPAARLAGRLAPPRPVSDPATAPAAPTAPRARGPPEA